MSYLVLARKYRPQTFDEVVQQEHVTRTLKNAINSDRVAHAVLFTGPRGTGKTTAARVLAKAMNCLKEPTATPCNQCRSCLEITSGHATDVFEIDGASNNSVDQVRDLRENVKYMPANSRYKIYIIDEVHMLTVAAFNALLKTLEEPPAHVMFIFATTEPHKIPVTILSRCQRHDFKRIDIDSIAGHLDSICHREGATLDSESLWMISREAGGSMRDALSLLDQVLTSAGEAFTPEMIVETLGTIDRKMVFDAGRAILSGDISSVLVVLEDVFSRGHDLKRFYREIVEHFRNMLVVKMNRKVDDLVDLPKHEISMMAEDVKDVTVAHLNGLFELLFKEENAIRLSNHPKMGIEMVFFRLSLMEPPLSIDLLIRKLDRLKNRLSDSGNFVIKEPRASANVRKSSAPASLDQNVQKKRNSVSEAPSGSVAYEPDEPMDRTWKRLLDKISENHPSLFACLARSELTKMDDAGLYVEVNGSEFNINMLRKRKNIDILGKICEAFFGRKMKITFQAKSGSGPNSSEKRANQEVLKKEALEHPLVADAIDIFDGRVVDVKIIEEEPK